jgi:hypothetical protein
MIFVKVLLFLTALFILGVLSIINESSYDQKDNDDRNF